MGTALVNADGTVRLGIFPDAIDRVNGGDYVLRFVDGLVTEKHTYAKADVPRLEPGS